MQDPFNQYALRGQLVCAADELCLGSRYDEGDAVTDRMLFGDKAYDEAIDYLLTVRHSRWRSQSSQFPMPSPLRHLIVALL